MANDNTALARQQDAQIEQRQEQTERGIAAQVKTTAVDPEIIAMASAIYTATPGMSKEQAVAAAFHFKTTGEIMGRDSYIGTGKQAGKILEGYRAVARNVKHDIDTPKYRQLTTEEIAAHGVEPGDKSLACEIALLDVQGKCRKMGIPYRPIVGITVIRAGTKIQVPNTKTELWVLQKQSRVDGLKQIPGGACISADEIYEDAGLTGDEMPPVHLSMDRAKKWSDIVKRQRANKAEYEAKTPEQRKADSLRIRRQQARSHVENEAPFTIMSWPEMSREEQEAYIETETAKLLPEEPASDNDSITDAAFKALPAASQSVSPQPTPAHERIKARLLTNANFYRMQELRADSDTRIKKAKSLLTFLIPNEDDRHLFRLFVFGAEDTSAWDHGIAEMLLDWIKLSPGERDATGKVLEWIPSGQSVMEVAAILAAIKPSLIEQPVAQGDRE
jgi:hypothetical protein